MEKQQQREGYSMFGKPLKELVAARKKFTLLQTGDTGHGKTARALTATQFGPLYVIDLDGKLSASMRNIPAEYSKYINFDIVYSNDYSNASYDDILTEVKGMATEFAAGKQPFATLCIDTFTHLNELAKLKYLGIGVKAASKDPRQLWGMVSDELINLFSIVLGLPCNLIVNAHVAKTEDALGNERLGVEGVGSFKNSLPKRMSDAQYLFFSGGKWQIRAVKSDSVPANSCIDPTFLNPDGTLKRKDLGVFADYAYKVLPKG